MLGWAGLRGATPIVFATFPVTEGSRGDDDLPGRVLRRAALDDPAGADDRAGRALARRDRDEAAIPVPLVEPVILNRLGAETMQFPVRHGDAIEGRPVRELGLPREALLNVIVRGERAIPPSGSTIIRRATSCTCSCAKRSRWTSGT